MSPARRDLSQPDDWWSAWKEAAEAKGMNLSEWIGWACNQALPKHVQDNLETRVSRGRPRKCDRT